MKTATAFIVAVTVFASVFLESSAAPNPHIEDITNGVGGLVSGITKGLGNSITSAGEIAGKIIAKTGETVAVATEALGNKAAEDIKNFKQVIGKIFEGFEATFQAVNEAAAALGGEIGEKLKEALIKLQSKLKELIILAEKLVKAAAEGADGTVKELKGLIENLVLKLKADVAGIIQILDLIPEKAGKDVSFVIDIVTGSLVKVDKLIEDILSKVAEALKSKTTKVVNGVKKLDESNFEEYVEKEIKTCEEAIAALEDVVKRYLAKVSDEEEKEIVAKVIKWLKKFVPMVTGIHKELRETVKVNDLEKLKKVIEKILEVIKNTKMQVNELIKTQADEIKEAINKYILEVIVPHAQKFVEMVEKKWE